ncbi:winged helix-turn-helix domain-containing protein [Variovorax sp. 770b2]|jgi:DNA-binding response OmpR family regulator|uniref:winged helix-turn-helix domain-containing protein n=1 Tax=Variovorax sp. 770b2 TaxID=1566271 RepID=UPI0008EC94F2|nr:winged helix-turn-helix domain-containing protein [Variovorax sp. 770b2]SFP83506.1 DNA-binding response regulator, OmpR family, contains REC and winged-helix (wHTH) domain [Variovorax sp. 770b2]
MNGTRAPSSVALVDSAEIQRLGLTSRLERRGYLPMLFSGVSELLAALASGRQFEALLLMDDGTAAWGRLSAVCSVLGMPALLLTHETRWKTRAEPDQDLLLTPLFDFATSDSTDIELDARLRNLIQRTRASGRRHSQALETTIGGYEFLEGPQIVVHKGREIMLQPRQFELALELFRNVGRLLTREWLWNSFWGPTLPRDGVRALDVCVANVRRKLELRPENGFTLRAVYRRGYQLRTTPPRTRLDAGLALATAPKPPTFAHAEGALNGLALGPAASLGPDAGLQLS